MLTNEQIAEIAVKCDDLVAFAYGIESAATEPLLARIAELEQDNASLRTQNDMLDKALAELEAKLAQKT